MDKLELQRIALSFVDKGYADPEKLRYSDDLYNADEEDIDLCLSYLDEILEKGTKAFEEIKRKYK